VQAIVWVVEKIIIDLTPFLIHIREACKGKLDLTRVNTLPKGIPYGKIVTIPRDGKIINTQILRINAKCTKAQIRERNKLTSEIKKVLNPLEIVFSTITVILPSLDSICKSLNQQVYKASKIIIKNKKVKTTKRITSGQRT